MTKIDVMSGRIPVAHRLVAGRLWKQETRVRIPLGPIFGSIDYRLGRQVFILESGVRFPVELIASKRIIAVES